MSGERNWNRYKGKSRTSCKEKSLLRWGQLAGGKVIQMPQTVPERAVAEQTDREIETEADETTLGLASSWG